MNDLHPLSHTPFEVAFPWLAPLGNVIKCKEKEDDLKDLKQPLIEEKDEENKLAKSIKM